jgi:hypothetical protein
LSSVVGGEGAWWASGEEVEVGEGALDHHDHQSDACLDDLASGPWTGTVALGWDELDIDEFRALWYSDARFTGEVRILGIFL